MKYILTVIFLVNTFCFAQSLRGDSIDYKISYDTVPVIMLIMDTSRNFYVSLKQIILDTPRKFVNYNGDTVLSSFACVNDTIWYQPDHAVYWVKGYGIKPRCTNCFPFRDYSEFLDEKKKKFKRTNLIWEVIRINTLND